MRRTTRLFEIIQLLRAARRPLTADALAETLEVARRTIYRDIASLQAISVPIHGEAGIGYVMRAGYDLPPLMLTVEEVEALAVALSLLARTGDSGLREAAGTLQGKIAGVLPREARRPIEAPSLHVSPWGAAAPAGVDLGLVRRAIRDERKLAIAYADEAGRQTRRTVLPVAVIYYVEVTAIAAWCELRQAFRHFRADRIRACSLLEADFHGRGAALRTAWSAERGGVPGP